MVVAALFEPFPLWRLRREQPELAERPLAAVADERVVHASVEARRAGIVAGLSLAGAKLKVEDLVVTPAEAPLLQSQWEALLDELYGLTPTLESLARGRALLKLSLADANLLAASYRIRVGVASNRHLALLAALSAFVGKVRVIPENDERGFLDTLPLHFLRGVGLSAQSVEELRWLGVERCGQLFDWRKPQFEAYLGSEAKVVMPYLHGPWDTRVAEYRQQLSLETAYDFDDLAQEPYQLIPVLRHLSERLVAQLGERVARRLSVTAYTQGLAFSAGRFAKEPLKDIETVHRLAVMALTDSGATPLGIDRLELNLSGLVRLSEQLTLWRQKAAQAAAIAAVSERYPDALLRIQLNNPWSMAIDQRYHFVTLSSDEHHVREIEYAPNTTTNQGRRRQLRTAEMLAVP